MGCPQSKKEPEMATSFTDINEPPPKTVDPRLPFETYRQLFNMKNSWKAVARCMEATAKTNLLNLIAGSRLLEEDIMESYHMILVDYCLRFLQKYPQYRECHKDLLKYKDDEEKMVESTAFEIDSTVMFNAIDFVMEKAEDNLDAAIKNLKLTGRTYSKMPNFQLSYFKDMEDVFLECVKNVLGDRFTEPTERNFRMLWEFCVQQMTEVIQPA